SGQGLDGMPSTGVNAVTVPGAIARYEALLERFGTLTFQETFERAAQIAEEGWGQGERRHADLVSSIEKLARDPGSARTFLEEGEAPALYSMIRNPELGRSPRLLQQEGA